MDYFVIETQVTDGVGSAIVNHYPSRDVAEQQYHTILSAAAVSQVDRHGAIMISSDYRFFKNEVYDKTSGELVTVSNEQ